MPEPKLWPFGAIGDAAAQPGSKPGDRITIGGIPVTVVSRAKGETAEFVVCVGITLPLVFPDNRTGPCRDCGDTLQWRPHAPKKPPKVCLPCAEIRALKERM